MKDKKTQVGVTMADVARQAGVHPSTVSRALKRDPRITQEVQNMVRGVADSMGYRPNPLISALTTLRRQHTRLTTPAVLAYIQREKRHLPPDFYGASQTADLNGYKVEAFNISNDLSEKRLNQILTHRNIRGLILAPLPEAHGSFTLDWDRFATVALEYSFTHPRFDRVVPDSFQSVMRALEQCSNLGHTRVGVVLTRTVHERNEGLLMAADLYYKQKPALTQLPALIVDSPKQMQTFRSWLLREQPQVIISSNHLIPSIEQSLKSLKINVPRNVGIVNLNTNPETQIHSGIYLDSAAMGTQAVVHLVHKLNNNQFGVPDSRITIQTDVQWIDGKTLMHAEKMVRPATFRKSPPP